MTCRALGSKCGPTRPGPSAGAACKCPPRSSRSAAAIAGTAKAASRRKSRRVASIRGLSSGLIAASTATGSPSVDEEELVRVEQHEAELIEAVPRREAHGEPSLAILRRPREGQPPGTLDLPRAVVARFSADPPGELPGTL